MSRHRNIRIEGADLDPAAELLSLDRSTHRERWILWGILALALLVRLAGLFEDLPFSYYGDELHFIKRAMSLGTGDLNPHWFHKPALLMYVLAFFYGLYYLIGALFGVFSSTSEFGAFFLNEPGSFILIGRLIVLCFGLATVYLLYRVARYAFDSARHGLVTALVAALIFPLVAGSQSVKADVPAAFFVAASLLGYLHFRRDQRIRHLVAAAALAGLATATKYYGLILLPGYLACEWIGSIQRSIRLRTTLARNALVLLVFVAAFFAASPFNFIDPLWRTNVTARIESSFAPAADTRIYDPDSQVSYSPGAAGFLGGAAYLFRQAIRPKAFGPGIALLFLLGLIACLLARKWRLFGIGVLPPLLIFVLGTSTYSAYHLSWRHLNAVLPLLCPLALPGVLLICRVVRLGDVRARLVGPILVALLLAPSLFEVVRSDLQKNRLDSRSVAHDWILRELPPKARMLVDDYGPAFNLAAPAVERLRKILATLPPGEAFTRHQKQRLDLLERFPAADARDVDVLAQPWWLDREVPDEKLHASSRDRDMGTPLKQRVPDSLREYREKGVRYVVTRSISGKRYLASSARREAFPSFARFYEALGKLKPVRVFDPTTWGGKGPIVLVYDLEASAGAGR